MGIVRIQGSSTLRARTRAKESKASHPD